MKNLEQYIDSHRDELDILEPEDGHFQRFEKRLNSGLKFSFTWLLRIAAVIFIAAFISVKLISNTNKENDNLSSELKELAYYYNLRTDDLISEINKNAFLKNTEKQQLLRDIKNFDSEYSSLKNDLKKFPEDERLVNAFIDFHRSKTEYLESILNQINTTNLINI